MGTQGWETNHLEVQYCPPPLTTHSLKQKKNMNPIRRDIVQHRRKEKQ
jgi:hypothetical protein